MTVEERVKPKVEALIKEAGLLVVLRCLMQVVGEIDSTTKPFKVVKKAYNDYAKWYGWK